MFRRERIKEKGLLFEENLSEYENMLNNGYDRIWDCGLDKWEMKIKG